MKKITMLALTAALFGHAALAADTMEKHDAMMAPAMEKMEHKGSMMKHDAAMEKEDAMDHMDAMEKKKDDAMPAKSM